MTDSNLTPYENADGLIEPISCDILSIGGGGSGEMRHNFPADDPDEMWHLSSLASGPECNSGSDIIGQVIDMRYWLVHEVEIMDDDGTLTRSVRTVLIAKNGAAYSFVSTGILRSLQMFLQCYGLGPYDDPRPVQVIQSDTKGGRRILHLRPAPKKGRK